MSKLLKYVLTGIVVLGFALNPVVLHAAETEELRNACTQAEFDAKKDVNGTLWLAIGFFGSIFGVGAAYLFEPTPPPSRIMGKSSEYVATYTDCYKVAGKSVQTKSALRGCVVSGVLIVVWDIFWLLI
ncbi:MAG TPA: hypothetical protein PKU94_02585 [Candidatus Hydrothermia bacterium]|nr:hypothetical protein [Candidatus Hydrothermae bacterium]MDD3649472.1 hypothetical protein [Candidatus Hydrothermia bacterium]MDD5572839.1 hypothetical protein [Candidatus Hydrothermia bacterium]HOK22809.1 hypothetical protein [Candidatus Hydrothermia bacterium]HOL23518.1 hypothetical protein [Candidatus Hydrothermia bacterium]